MAMHRTWPKLLHCPVRKRSNGSYRYQTMTRGATIPTLALALTGLSAIDRLLSLEFEDNLQLPQPYTIRDRTIFCFLGLTIGFA